MSDEIIVLTLFFWHFLMREKDEEKSDETET